MPGCKARHAYRWIEPVLPLQRPLHACGASCMPAGDLPEPAFPDAETALFVTWKVSPKIRHEHARLRGCIGILEPRPLRKGLRDYALTSALRDSRFGPIELWEVSGNRFPEA